MTVMTSDFDVTLVRRTIDIISLFRPLINLPIYYYYYCDKPSHIQQCTHMAYKSTEARNRQDSSVAVRHNTFANMSISHDQHRYTNSSAMCLRQMRGCSKSKNIIVLHYIVFE